MTIQCRQKHNLSHLSGGLFGNKNQKLENVFPFDLAILLLGNHPKGIIRNRHKNIHPNIVYNMGKLQTTDNLHSHDKEPVKEISFHSFRNVIKECLLAWDDVNS